MAQGWGETFTSRETEIDPSVIKENWREWAKEFKIPIPERKVSDNSSHLPGEVKTYFVEPSPVKPKKRRTGPVYIPGVFIDQSPDELETDEKILGYANELESEE